jgi:hypothetical protein
MPTRPRPPRVAVNGARLQFANTVAELVNMSPSGALIRMGFELRKGGEWPLVLELPEEGQVWLNGRVVRCRPEGTSFLLALTFVSPSSSTQAVLNGICSTSLPAPAREKRPRPLPWRLPTLSLERLLRIRVSPNRQCPECHSADLTKERRHSYSCFQCGCRFSGFRLGRVRISL